MPAARLGRTIVQSIPEPRANDGIWVPYDGSRWYLIGAAVPYVADAFVAVGEYRGFPVYRMKKERSDDIYIPSVHGGPLAPYRKR